VTAQHVSWYNSTLAHAGTGLPMNWIAMGIAINFALLAVAMTVIAFAMFQ